MWHKPEYGSCIRTLQWSPLLQQWPGHFAASSMRCSIRRSARHRAPPRNVRRSLSLQCRRRRYLLLQPHPLPRPTQRTLLLTAAQLQLRLRALRQAKPRSWLLQAPHGLQPLTAPERALQRLLLRALPRMLLMRALQRLEPLHALLRMVLVRPFPRLVPLRSMQRVLPLRG